MKTPTGGQTRPAMDATREAVFSSLGELVQQAAVLDLFAGCGAYGLEAISRGAGNGTFIEKDLRALRCLQANAEAVTKSLGEPRMMTIKQGDVFRQVLSNEDRYDLIFADPPYAILAGQGEDLLSIARQLLAASSRARLILEAPGDWHPPAIDGLSLLKRLGKGRKQATALIFQAQELSASSSSA